MAKMVGYITGSQLNARMTKDGAFRKNAKIDANIDYNLIVRKVYKKIKDEEKRKRDEMSSKMDEDGVSSSDAITNRKSRWKLSQSGMTMITTQLVSSGIRNYEAMASTDRANIASTAYTTTKGTAMLALSTFGGPYGQVAAILLNRLDGLVGQYFKNQIQLQYDNARLNYNLSIYDIGRFSTYTYDHDSKSWTARDVEKVKRNILNQG